jgi:MFS family permease
MAVCGGILADRKGSRWPIIVGFCLLLVSLLWINYFSDPGRTRYLFPGLIAFGCGIPLIFSPAFAAAMTDVEVNKFGPASSMITMSRQLAATIGIALMTALFESVLAHTDSYASAFSATLFLGIGFACIGLIIAVRFVKKAAL